MMMVMEMDTIFRRIDEFLELAKERVYDKLEATDEGFGKNNRIDGWKIRDDCVIATVFDCVIRETVECKLTKDEMMMLDTTWKKWCKDGCEV